MFRSTNHHKIEHFYLILIFRHTIQKYTLVVFNQFIIVFITYFTNRFIQVRYNSKLVRSKKYLKIVTSTSMSNYEYTIVNNRF